ncbi:cytochrome b/b6 domain-containing protein [Oceanimonas smirnovii]|uniref:cytochrome b/b6 domain-containing protein n=1 Tax=Oceanimonas smirnovii TaxID=264574 RepID=UPI000476E6E5|nr:cytochrome b/b6 domain-containing protein [Oceanimonas smirnovii]
MSTPPSSSVPVWDWSIRLFHWSMPVLMALLWYYAGEDMDKHMLFAQILISLVLYRVIWGFIGTPYARFSHFVYHPRHIVAYLRASLTPQKPVYLSHNPMGGIMVLVLLGGLLLQAGTGLFATDDIFYTGPLYDYVTGDTAEQMTRWHKRWFYWGILVLVGLHVCAVLLYRLRGENLVGPMITGRKQAPAERVADRLPGHTGFPWLRFIIAAIIAWGAVEALFRL